MKKIILLFVFTLFALNGVAQIHKVSQNFEKVEGRLKVKYFDKYFDIDTTIITVKIKDVNKISKDYKIIRNNKLGFADLLLPNNKPIEELLKFSLKMKQ